jgi:hypothetical protein
LTCSSSGEADGSDFGPKSARSAPTPPQGRPGDGRPNQPFRQLAAAQAIDGETPRAYRGQNQRNGEVGQCQLEAALSGKWAVGTCVVLATAMVTTLVGAPLRLLVVPLFPKGRHRQGRAL